MYSTPIIMISFCDIMFLYYDWATNYGNRGIINNCGTIYYQMINNNNKNNIYWTPMIRYQLLIYMNSLLLYDYVPNDGEWRIIVKPFTEHKLLNKQQTITDEFICSQILYHVRLIRLVTWSLQCNRSPGFLTCNLIIHTFNQLHASHADDRLDDTDCSYHGNKQCT